MGSREISLLTSFGLNSGRLVEMTVQMLSTLNLNRMSCKACLSAGRLWINDTDDIRETTLYGIRRGPHDIQHT